MLGPGAALQCVSPGLWGQTDLLSSPSFTVITFVTLRHK